MAQENFHGLKLILLSETIAAYKRGRGGNQGHA